MGFFIKRSPRAMIYLNNLPFVDLGSDSSGAHYTVKQVYAGYDRTCAILNNDQIKCWGKMTAARRAMAILTTAVMSRARWVITCHSLIWALAAAPARCLLITCIPAPSSTFWSEKPPFPMAVCLLHFLTLSALSLAIVVLSTLRKSLWPVQLLRQLTHIR